jgi:type IV secretory pathway VirB3-like protein
MAVTGPFTLIYIPRTLIVAGNGAATADAVRAHETLFRFGMAAELLGAILFIFVGLALYRVLAGVNKAQASLMVVLVLVSVALGLMNVLNNFAALVLFRGAEFLAVFDRPQLDALGVLFLGLHRQGNLINESFWGLWLFPFGLLVMRSGFLPRILGLLLLVNGGAYVAMSLTSLVMPDYGAVVARAALPALLGEVFIMAWLLVKGASEKRTAAAA